jgi:hypothetical protein
MKVTQASQTIVVIGPGLIPPGPGGVTLARVPLALLKKYSSPKPLRRPAPRQDKK